MSYVVINIVTVPRDQRAEFEARFSTRAGLVEKQPGFESFELLRPENSDEYFVYTRWRSREDFECWISSDDFRRGHAQHSGDGPIGTSSEIKTFEVAEEKKRTRA
ncbi:MAG: antibiotic biosynthesis monooxygenase [Acidimicrobiia bacterium]